MAHVELAKAELSAIGQEIARAIGLAVGALSFVLLAFTMLVIGTSLFTAEWLLGSMGWGVLHGVLLFIGIAVALALSVVGMSPGRIGRSFVVALIIGVLASILFAFDLPNQAYTAIGDAVAPGIEAGVRPLVVGTVLWGIIGLLGGIGLAFRMRRRGGGADDPSQDGFQGGAILGGLLAGLLIGAFTSITFGVQPGIGVGMAIGYVAWIVLMGLDMSRTGIDVEALQARFTPTRTIETSKETLAWLQSKMPPGTGS
jgi:hypothetical protein